MDLEGNFLQRGMNFPGIDPTNKILMADSARITTSMVTQISEDFLPKAGTSMEIKTFVSMVTTEVDQEGAHLEGVHLEGVHREGVHREAVHQEGVHREAAHQEEVHKEDLQMVHRTTSICEEVDRRKILTIGIVFMSVICTVDQIQGSSLRDRKDHGTMDRVGMSSGVATWVWVLTGEDGEEEGGSHQGGEHHGEVGVVEEEGVVGVGRGEVVPGEGDFEVLGVVEAGVDDIIALQWCRVKCMCFVPVTVLCFVRIILCLISRATVTTLSAS